MIGIDEVGRGCLAGPLLVVAARPSGILPAGLKDSKLMSRTSRLQIMSQLISRCEFGEGWVEPMEIDSLGLANALRLGIKRALKDINAVYNDEIIYDGPVNYAPPVFRNVKCMIGADKLVPLVSAASIYAKVKRDQLMMTIGEEYPVYGFEKHVGYATKQHKDAIRQFGPILQLHRMSFSPLRQLEMSI